MSDTSKKIIEARKAIRRKPWLLKLDQQQREGTLSEALKPITKGLSRLAAKKR